MKGKKTRERLLIRQKRWDEARSETKDKTKRPGSNKK